MGCSGASAKAQQSSAVAMKETAAGPASCHLVMLPKQARAMRTLQSPRVRPRLWAEGPMPSGSVGWASLRLASRSVAFQRLISPIMSDSPEASRHKSSNQRAEIPCPKPHLLRASNGAMRLAIHHPDSGPSRPTPLPAKFGISPVPWPSNQATSTCLASATPRRSSPRHGP